jgi:GDP-D-mannose dehydratase
MNYWTDRKVFITGVNGFVGSNLAKVLINKGSKVFGLVRNMNPKRRYYKFVSVK